jgi:predicted nucleotidyltransferase
MGMITTAPIKVETLLKDNKMNSNDFINTCTIIETVFQTAIARGHPILILTPFGHEEENNPISDIIKVYNYCIYKYGHWFKRIIVAVPTYYPKSVFDSYQQNIINPIDIVSEIDDECEADEMRQCLMSKSTTNKQLENQIMNPEMNQMNSTNQMNPMFNMTPEQIQMMMNMMNMNMNQQK